MTVGSMLQTIELPDVPLLPKAKSPRRRGGSFSQRVKRLLTERSLDEFLKRNPRFESGIVADAKRLAGIAYPELRTTDRQSASWIDNSARDELHRALLLLYQQHMKLPHENVADYQFHPLACRLMLELEGPWERDMLRRAHSVHDLSPEGLPAAVRA
jgi:hypothetical protein